MINIETTLPNKDTATKLANLLLKEKLCACIHLSPIESFYIWDSEIKNDDEFLLRIKTSKEMFQKLSATITKHHPYEVPEIIATDIIDIEEKYKNWLKTSLKS